MSWTNRAPSALPDGTVAISRAVPPVTVPQITQLGFVPPLAAHSGHWLAIDLSHKKAVLMEDDRVVDTAPFDDAGSIKKGEFQLLHKQRNPLWYAPDAYFSKRGQKVPPQGDRSRYRRGALGDFALFVDKDTPIHSSPVWTDDVGGIRISESYLSRLYYRLEVGSFIQIK